MANKIFNIRVKNKRDTEANWKKKNPVLLDGEIIIVTTTSGDTRFKVGDGKKTYNQLPFQDQKTRDLIPSVDSSLSSTSTNPVQNKIIKSELDKKAERDVVNTTTNGLMSVADKKKLDGIAAGANKTIVDDALNATSKNPVQNQAVYAELNNKLSKSGGTITGNLFVTYGTSTSKEVVVAGGKVQADDWVQGTNGVSIGKGSSSGSFVSLRCDRSSSDTVESLKVIRDLCLEEGDLAHVTIADPVDGNHATTKNYVDTELGKKLNKSGGTLTGNLTGKYITGTWLQTTEATDLGRAPKKVAVLDDSGWVYYRTPSELLSDIGGVAINNFIDTIYPLGSIYITTSSTHPNVLFPNTFWVPIYDRFLLGGGNNYKVGSTGGEATHALTANEMPKHNHDGLYYSYQDTENSITLNSGSVGYHIPWGSSSYPGDYGAGIGGAELITGEAGAGVAHNNMPPYLAVHVWKRVTFDEYEAGI